MLYGLFKIYNIWTFLINKVNKVKIETVKYVEVVDVSVISAKKGATDSLSEFSACVSFQMEISAQVPVWACQSSLLQIKQTNKIISQKLLVL